MEISLNEVMRGRLEGGRWLVGVSGGGDSVALLRLLVEAGLSGKIVVGNFDHGWGNFGRESQRFVRALCERQGAAFVAGKGTGKAATNAEAVAREERYGWMKKVCEERGLDGVLVAHSVDDQIETFLMRLGKGSALQGLVGMPEVGNWQGMPVLRPLLGAERDGLRGYLRDLRQDWMEDPDNAEGGSQRARIRRLLPMMEAAGIGVVGMAASIKALGQAHEVVERVVDRVEITWLAGGAAMELGVMRGVEEEVGSRVLGRLMERLVPDAGVVRRGKRINLLAKLAAADSGAATLGGLKFEWKDGAVRVTVEHKGNAFGIEE